jgi:hypothetical protein
LAVSEWTVRATLEPFGEGRLVHTIEDKSIPETGIEQKADGAVEVMLWLRLTGNTDSLVGKRFRVFRNRYARPSRYFAVMFELLGHVPGCPRVEHWMGD